MKTPEYPPRNYNQINQNSTRRTLFTRMAVGGAATFIALILSGVSALGFTNYMANPGFEARYANWTTEWPNNYAIETTNSFINGSTTIHTMVYDGTNVFKLWGGYQTWATARGAYQMFPAAGASTWTADCWASTQAPDNLTGDNQFYLELTFRDAMTNSIVTYKSAIIDTNSPTSTWIHLVVTDEIGSTNLTAPDGTAFVRCRLVFSQPAAPPYDDNGSVYVDDVTLFKTSAPDPEISAPPHDQTVVYGQTATFNVLASGRTTLSYKWQKDGVDLSNGGNVSGATTTTLTISNVTTADQGYYSVIVTDTAGSLSSSPGYLTVLDPGILTNPAAKQAKIEGQTASFTVVAAGSGTLTYAWSKDGLPLSNDGRISGADSATLTIANLTTADISANYGVQVTGAGMAFSAPAALFVKTIPQASNLMLDKSFEMGTFDFWNGWNGRSIVTAPPGGETNYDGSYICRVTGTGDGTWNGVNQSFAVTPGAVYTANAWFLVSAGEPITGAADAWLEVNFYRNTIMMNSFQSPHITSNSVAGVWTNLVVSNVTPPAGADEVRCQINYHAVNGGGSIYLDDVSFWLKIPVTVTASVSGSNLLLSFPTQIGVNYQVLYKDDLNDAAWQVLTTLTGDMSGQASVLALKDASKRFYRVNTL